MRPALVAVLALVILGGVKWFLDSHAPVAGNGSPVAQLISASGEYSVELTMTFDVGPDEFSLDDAGDAPTLLLQLNGKELLKRTDTVAATDSPIVLEKVDVAVGKNEFFIQASPSEMDELKPRSIRVRVLQDGTVVANETIWPEAGDVLQGTVALEVTQ